MLKKTIIKSHPLSCSVRMIWLSILLLAPALAYAQPELRLTMVAEIERTTVVNNETVTSYEAADNTTPGDRLAYTIKYNNAGSEPALNASLTGIIPPEATFLKILEMPANTTVRFSIDGGKSYHEPPVMVEVTTTEGKIEKHEAEAESYTHIRFTLNTAIPPEATGQVGYLVQIR